MRRTAGTSLLVSAALAGPACAICPVGAVDTLLHPSDRPISQGYGLRVHPLLNAERLHQGIDYAGPVGGDVKSAAAGTVISAGYAGQAGYSVAIQHADGLATHYHHMLMREIVKAGDCVSAGQLIGRVGSTGLSSEPHLHFEVARNGQAIDPETVLPKR